MRLCFTFRRFKKAEIQRGDMSCLRSQGRGSAVGQKAGHAGHLCGGAGMCATLTAASARMGSRSSPVESLSQHCHLLASSDHVRTHTSTSTCTYVYIHPPKRKKKWKKGISPYHLSLSRAQSQPVSSHWSQPHPRGLLYLCPLWFSCSWYLLLNDFFP